MTIVGNAGEARSLAYEALREAKTGNLINRGTFKRIKKNLFVAHGIQTELICNKADGNGIAMESSYGSCSRPPYGTRSLLEN